MERPLLLKGLLKYSLFFFFYLGISSAIYSQVTIGSNEGPERGAALDVKTRNAANVDKNNIITLENSEKGFLYPKVSLKTLDQLTPLYGGEDLGNGNWSDLSSEKDKLLATGMVVYNINAKAKEMEEGLYMWRVSEWIKLSGVTGKALFDVLSCANIEVNGSYIAGKAVDASNYLTIKLNVRKRGAYSIAGSSGNGYNFFLSGVALDEGQLTLNVPCQGVPKIEGLNIITLQGVELSDKSCLKINVMSKVAEYSLNCSSIKVIGKYIKGRELNNCEIRLNVTVTSPGSYEISTPKVNGISFTSKGNFLIPATYSIVLTGSGKPTVNSDFPITINANTEQGNTKCSTIIPMTLPAMTYGIIGYGVWSWSEDSRKKALTSGVSFGPNGTVRIENLTEAWAALNLYSAKSRMTESIKPDIILYFAFGVSPDTELTNLLRDYIDKGGCVIYGSADGTMGAVNDLMAGLFGMRPAINQSGGKSADDVYLINNLPNDPVINGPFGNLCNRYWGEDNASIYSIIMTQLPPNSVQICSARTTSKRDKDPLYSIVWYNDSKNFLYIGDSTGSSATDISSVSYPSKYSSTGVPESKWYGPVSALGETNEMYMEFVYNSALELNAVAWALRKAAVSGINPH